jgi:hypothetical protein
MISFLKFNKSQRHKRLNILVKNFKIFRRLLEVSETESETNHQGTVQIFIFCRRLVEHFGQRLWHNSENAYKKDLRKLHMF